jgi:two-component system LytT family response regulator
MKTAVVIDDNYVFRKTIIALIEHLDLKINFLGEASEISTGLEICNSMKPDVLFLDYDLPDGTGLDLLNNISYEPFTFLITGHDFFSISEIKYPNVHFIQKPVDIDKIKEILINL